MRPLTTEQFIEKARVVHGQKFDYSLVEYKNSKTKVRIICHEHGEFLQAPFTHLSGSECPNCAYGTIVTRLQKDRLSQEEFLRRCAAVNLEFLGDKYEGKRGKVKVKCQVHGEFIVGARNIIQGHGCRKCAGAANGAAKRLSEEEFYMRVLEAHGDRYDYSQVKYEYGSKNITIICKIHGKFRQTPCNHAKGRGCPKCKISRGEAAIERVLEEAGIYNVREHKLDKLDLTSKMRFDFFIPELNTAIEYDGEHHFQEVGHYKRPLAEVQLYDRIKDDYCKTFGIRLIRIPYTEFENIEKILNEVL